MKPKKKITGALGKVLSLHNAVRKYLKNINAQGVGKHTARNYIDSTREAISGLFQWGLTPEGYDFWKKINDEYIHEFEQRQICYKTNEPCKYNCIGLCRESH